jgi:magnesium-transporting ATPase (P-type)
MAVRACRESGPRADFVHLRISDLSPADICIVNGNILLDQSALTGESVPVEAEAVAYANRFATNIGPVRKSLLYGKFHSVSD